MTVVSAIVDERTGAKLLTTYHDFYSRRLVVRSVTLDGLTSSDVVGAESAGECAED